MRKRKLLILFLFFSLLYAAILLFGKTDPATLAKYHLSQTRTHQLNATIVIPIILIWFTAFWGFTTIKRYAEVIHDTNEGHAFAKISTGLGLLAFSLPVNSAVSVLVGYYLIDHPSALTTLTILRNYTALILPLLAFISISQGSLMLTKLINRRKAKAYSAELWALGVIAVSSIFSWMMVARPTDARDSFNVYQLPNWLIITTLTIPFLYTWFRGISAVYYISAYNRNVKGVLYRKSLRLISGGILTVISTNILTQLILTLSNRLYRLQLTPILIIVYILVTMYAVGFGLIASGAKKLRKLEEI